MRIRRRDKDPAETGGSDGPRVGPYDYDEEPGRVTDGATSQPSTPTPLAGNGPGAVPSADPAPATAGDLTAGSAAAAVPEEPGAQLTPETPEAVNPATADVVTPPVAGPVETSPSPQPALSAEGTPSAAPPQADTAPPQPAPAHAAAAPPATTAVAPEPAPGAPKHAMRAPSIADEATELLNGSKPAPRELPRIIAIANQKGGVGKTTTTVNLGAALADLDYRVLVIDLDPQGNATTGLGVEARNFELSMYDVIMRDQPLEDCIEPTSVKNLFVAPATIDLAGVEIELVPAFSRELKLKRAIDTVVDDFDFVIIDCPPSLGLITVNGLAAADEVLVPIQCEYYALEGLSQLLRNVNLVSTNLNQTLEVSTIVLTMFDARTRLSVDVANEVREHFSERVCRAVIPRTVRLSEAPSFGQPITVFDPTSRGAVAYRELAKEVSNGAPKRSR